LLAFRSHCAARRTRSQPRAKTGYPPSLEQTSSSQQLQARGTRMRQGLE
jgi:hypothetical protein